MPVVQYDPLGALFEPVRVDLRAMEGPHHDGRGRDTHEIAPNIRSGPHITKRLHPGLDRPQGRPEWWCQVVVVAAAATELATAASTIFVPRYGERGIGKHCCG
jgi:hypothetical protein